MKGISPMLATILLIAFTVAVGGIISLWLTTFSTTQTTQVTGTTEDQVRCLNSVLGVSTVGYSDGDTTVTVKVNYDQGTLTLDDVRAQVWCSGATPAQGTIAASISPGDVVSASITGVSSTCTSNTLHVRVFANCTGPATGTIYPVSADCKPGTGCIK